MRRDRLFHVIVGLASSAFTSTACGGKATGSSGLPGAGGGTADAGATPVRADAASDAHENDHPPKCPHTEQLKCESYHPAPVDCMCDESSPLSDADCVDERLSFTCAWYDPPMGCDCSYRTGPQ